MQNQNQQPIQAKARERQEDRGQATLEIYALIALRSLNAAQTAFKRGRNHTKKNLSGTRLLLGPVLFTVSRRRAAGRRQR
ncbi:hypothetical protein PoB_006162200 [Plakobranchus ocellatus]|uniref:Uncharacterized protein n=1 Tax=Plakobranchus ocellatus TaxID=259542 RepID=A0AAV4CT78_9GAST|nr:hypothetical protein PoB_006162200 [Plakobranchus ocellatus]